MKRPWTRAEILGLLGLGVAVIACGATLITVKEFRLLIGLPVDPLSKPFGGSETIRPIYQPPPTEKPPDIPSTGTKNITDPQQRKAERVSATGVGFAGSNFPREQRKYLAKRAAEVDARRRLAEIIGTRVRSTTETESGEIAIDQVLAYSNQLVVGAKLISERELADGGFEVTLEVEIWPK